MALSDIWIGESRVIGEGHRPLVVAEISANHGNSLASAKELIYQIAEAGADLVKLQTFTPESMTLRTREESFRVSGWTTEWNNRSAFDLYEAAQTPWEWHPELFRFARSLGLEIFSSPFSEEAIRLLETLDCPVFKVASYENTDVKLLRDVASRGKPVVVSTGASTLFDIARAHEELVKGGASDVVLMKCTSSYPAPPHELGIRQIPLLSETFGVHVGFSDHSLGIGAALASVALGACLIEKHVMLEEDERSPDRHFSLTPGQLRNLVDGVSDAHRAMEHIAFGPTESEAHGVGSKRSLFYSKPMRAGEIVDDEAISVLRPVIGVPASAYFDILGRSLRRPVEAGKPVKLEDFL